MSMGHRGMVIAVVGAALMGWSTTSRAQDREPIPPREGTAERLGEKLDNALRNASDSIQERFAAARTTVNNMGVEARIYGRLHWDKSLEDATIELEVRDDGVTTLSGSVRDAAAKAKAVELARDTVGVIQVVDRLSVSPPPTRTPRTPATSEPRP